MNKIVNLTVTSLESPRFIIGQSFAVGFQRYMEQKKELGANNFYNSIQRAIGGSDSAIYEASQHLTSQIANELENGVT